MVGGYILLNGEILAQIQSDDFENPTEISKTDFEKVYNAVKAGKELRIDLMGTTVPVITMKYDDTFCSLTFAYDDEGIKLLTFVLEVTVDDTDPDNPVYTYYGVVQQTEVGGGGGLYQHHITIKTGDAANNRKEFRFTIINDSETAFDGATLATYMNERATNNIFYPTSMDIIIESAQGGSPTVYYKRFYIATHIKTATTIGNTAAVYTLLEFDSESAWITDANTATIKILNSQQEYFRGSTLFYSFTDIVYSL